MGDFTNITLNGADAKPGEIGGGEVTKMAELKAKGFCDFCGEQCNADMQGAKAYDCSDFPMPMTGAMSHGAWGACPACAALIGSQQWDSLEERMTAIHSRRFGLVAEVMLPMLRRMHAQQVQLFRRHRIGATEEMANRDSRDSGMTGTFVQGEQQ